MKTPIELFGIECGPGWHQLLEPIFKYIDEYNLGKDDDECIELIQVKEKWGYLHIYVNFGTEELFELISKAETLSMVTCEKCGMPGNMRIVHGWKRTLCDACRGNAITRLERNPDNVKVNLYHITDGSGILYKAYATSAKHALQMLEDNGVEVDPFLNVELAKNEPTEDGAKYLPHILTCSL